MTRLRPLIRGVSTWMRPYWITLLVLGVALLSVRSVMAADGGATSLSETVQSFVGGVIAATLINLFTQRRTQRVEAKAENASARVNTLARELGVDNPQKTTPDVTKMQTRIDQLETDLTAVKNELVTTLEERDTARQAAANQVIKNAEDNTNAQTQIDRLTSDLQAEREISAKLERQIEDYDKRFRDQELKMARIEGRLDQQAVQDTLSNTMQTVAKLLNDVSLRLTNSALQPEIVST